VYDGSSVHVLSNLLLAYAWLVHSGNEQLARTTEAQIRPMLAHAEITAAFQKP
jgi:hypothetical protein